MIKVIFFDVDGTLFSHKQNDVPTSTRNVLNRLKENGIKCFLATGRHMTELAMLPVNDISFDAYITLNGQLCLTEDGEILSANPISGSDKEYILQLFHDKSVPVMLVEKDTMYINFVNDAVKTAQQEISTPIPDVRTYNGGEIYQAIVYIGKENETMIRNNLTNCKIIRWNPRAIDIISQTGGKTTGIKAYLKTMEISADETMAFGDAGNDIDMLEFVHIGVAMGNATDEVKAHADFVTASVDEDGIEKALFLIDAKGSVP